MSLKNPLGDVEITDSDTMRALSHPVRLAILSRLQRHGPATATQLSSHVDATPSVASWHLRHLAQFGLITEAESPDKRQRYWQAVSRGFRFEIPDDAEGRAAGHRLRDAMHAANLAQLSGWVQNIQPHLPPEWDQVAGASNTRVDVTATEAAGIIEKFEEILAPFVNRDGADLPADARSTRFLRYYMPAADDAD